MRGVSPRDAPRVLAAATGDTLGATVEVVEAVILVTAASGL
jgi:cobalamin synthase